MLWPKNGRIAMSCTLSDFPKLHCPFIRQTFKVNKDDWKQCGSSFQLIFEAMDLPENSVDEDEETLL
jgi:hypothetical protein